jgi:hypothetical protein
MSAELPNPQSPEYLHAREVVREATEPVLRALGQVSLETAQGFLEDITPGGPAGEAQLILNQLDNADRFPRKVEQLLHALPSIGEEAEAYLHMQAATEAAQTIDSAKLTEAMSTANLPTEAFYQQLVNNYHRKQNPNYNALTEQEMAALAALDTDTPS